MIKDQKYWQEVEKNGGLDNFDPKEMFFSNKVHQSRLQLINKEDDDDTNSQQMERKKSNYALLDEKGRVKKRFWNEMFDIYLKIKS